MVRLKTGSYLALAKERGHRTFEQKANAAGLGIGTIHRIVGGGAVGEVVIARLMTAYDTKFEELFEIPAAKAAPLKATA
jgi:hypothetical protein